MRWKTAPSCHACYRACFATPTRTGWPPSFRRVRESLAGLAPAAGQADPRVVIMTPGPHNETYFEHLYLSNYLDYTLIEGANLTVRDGRVWLKSVSGLEPVDVILRRVDDYYCDPLELRPDSLLGVPGLVEAVRCGRVAIANPLGAGILESPGLMAFLPRLSRHLLGQELRLPSIATWWCGQQRELDYVLANLSTLVLRPITRSGSTSLPVFGDQLDATGQTEWRARIQGTAAPLCRAGTAAPSSTPTLRDGLLYPHQSILRTFLAAGQNSYMVMPGGLTRVGETPASRMVSNQAGPSARTPGYWPRNPSRSSPATDRQGSLPQMQETLPGVAAENLFWLARYAERAEDMIRLLRNIHIRRNETLQVADPVNQTVLEMLLCGLTQMSMTYPGFTGDGAQARLAAPLAGAHRPDQQPPAHRHTGRQSGGLSQRILRRAQPDVGRYPPGVQ